MVAAGGDETSLEFTPTWVVALVCFCLVFISITVDGLIRCIGQLSKKHRAWLFFGASQKIKDELMLLGFISLLLAVFQTRIGKICMSNQLSNIMLPCEMADTSSTVAHFTASSFPSSGTRRHRILATASDATDYCTQKGKVPLLSVEAVHHLHIFVFVLATSHVVLCLLKVLSMIIQWSCLKIYDAILEDCENLQALGNAVVLILLKLDQCRKKIERMILKGGMRLYIKHSLFVSIMLAMLWGITSMTLSEYIVLRVNFIAARDPTVTGKDFQKYIMRTLQKEFRKMIGIRWYLWIIAVIYVLLNVAGWNAFFWMSFMPLILWLLATIKLECLIRQLAKDVSEKHKKPSSENSAEEKFVELPGDNHWYSWPRVVGLLIHVVLFGNSLELTFFFFILVQYGFHSCIMGKLGFLIPRVALGVIVQVLCISRTIPLYAVIKSQMHLRENQSGKKNKRHPDIEKIKMLLIESRPEDDKEECLKDLDEIKTRLEVNEMDEEEEMRIVNWISKWTTGGNKPSSVTDAPNIDSNPMGRKEDV